MKEVNKVMKACHHCKMVKRTWIIKIDVKELRDIPIHNLFHMITWYTISLLLETKNGNKYILVAIDHYSKWWEVKVVLDHNTTIATKFLEDEIIYRFGVPKCLLTDNGGNWVGKFDNLCKAYGIQHRFTSPRLPHYNGMAELMIKTIKHGIIVLFGLPKYVKSWDL
jgi:hypothetical protein